MKEFRVGVIIPTANRPKDLGVVLRSLLRQTILPREIIVVDGSDTGDTLESVTSVGKDCQSVQLRYIRVEASQRSLPKQRNIGVQSSLSPFLCFLDDDVDLDPRYLEEISGLFRSDVNRIIGGVGGNILDVMPLPRIFPFNLDKLLGLESAPMRMTRLGHNVGLHTVDGHPFKADWLAGCNFVIRREVFDSLAFEESFVGYSLYEDAVFSYELSKRMELWIQPTALLKHHRSETARLELDALNRMRMRNQYHVFKYCIENKNLLDHLKFHLFCLSLVVVRGGACAIHGFKRTHRKILSGTVVGYCDVLMRKYPRRMTTLKGVSSRNYEIVTSILLSHETGAS